MSQRIAQALPMAIKRRIMLLLLLKQIKWDVFMLFVS